MGRALADAWMGDEKRAWTDLKIAAQYGLEVGDARKVVKGDLARFRVTEPPDKLLDRLEKAAFSGKDIESLVPLALALERSWGQKALRYGEVFQKRLWELEEACRKNPKEPQTYVRVARYLVDEHKNRGEQVEPGRGLVPYRYQYSQQAELNYAVKLSDQALSLNQNYVPALVSKALALEEARLRLDDPPVSIGAPLPRDANDFALAMRMRLLLANDRIGEHHLAEALPLLQTNIYDGLDFAPGGRATEMFGAMLPAPGAPRIPVPKPLNGATLLAESYMDAGRIVRSLGRMDDALRDFQAAADLGRPPNYMIPNVGTGHGDNNFSMFAAGAAAEAQLELAKVYMAKGDYKTAFAYAQAATQNHPPERLRNELNEVNNSIVRHLNDQRSRNRYW
jgi:tetratricopeptide (TPR) repeat protein